MRPLLPLNLLPPLTASCVPSHPTSTQERAQLALEEMTRGQQKLKCVVLCFCYAVLFPPVYFSDNRVQGLCFLPCSACACLLACLHSIPPAQEQDGHAAPITHPLDPLGMHKCQLLLLHVCPCTHAGRHGRSCSGLSPQ